MVELDTLHDDGHEHGHIIGIHLLIIINNHILWTHTHSVVDENEESSIQTLESRFNTHTKSINLLDIFLVLEKLDGSMVMPIRVHNNHIVFRTKRGYFNNVTNEADLFVHNTQFHHHHHSGDTAPEKRMQYLEFCEYTMKQGLTPIFEFYSKQNMVVVEYSETFLTLIAIRSTSHGTYMPYEEMCELCEKFNVPYVTCIFSSKSNNNTRVRRSNNCTMDSTDSSPPFNTPLIIHTFEELKNKVNELRGIEGVVLRHKKTGEMFKLKTKWYSELHKKKQLITDSNPSPSHVWKLVLDESVDDFLPFLNTEKEKQELRRFNDQVWNAIDECAENALKVVQEAMNHSHCELNGAVDVAASSIRAMSSHSSSSQQETQPSSSPLPTFRAKEISQYITDHTNHNIIFRKIVFKVKGELDKRKLQQSMDFKQSLKEIHACTNTNKGIMSIMTPQEVVKYFIMQYIFKDLELVKECLNRPHLVYNNYRVI